LFSALLRRRFGLMISAAFLTLNLSPDIEAASMFHRDSKRKIALRI